MKTKLVVSLVIGFILMILCIYLMLNLQNLHKDTFQNRISFMDNAYQFDKSIHEKIQSFHVGWTNTYRKDGYCIVMSNDTVHPLKLLAILHQDPTIHYVCWVQPSLVGICMNHQFVRNSRDTFITLLYKNHRFDDNFIMIQRSRITFAILYHLYLYNDMNRTFSDSLQVKIMSSTRNIQYTYFFTIYINSLSISKPKKYHLQNKSGDITKPLIFQTWVTTTTDNNRIWYCYQKLMELYPEYPYQIFSDYDMKNFIRNHYSIEFVNQYDNIIPTAFKSDFFRYLYLYKNGGFYIDISVESRINMFDYIREKYGNYENDYDFISATDNGIKDGIWNGIMFSKKGSAIMSLCIQNIMNISKNQSQPCLKYTGPALLGDIIKKTQGNGERILLFQYQNSMVIRDKDTNKILFHPKHHSSDGGSRVTKKMYQESSKHHYSTHCIYNKILFFSK